MSTPTRRVFLEVIGAGTVSSALCHAGCIGGVSGGGTGAGGGNVVSGGGGSGSTVGGGGGGAPDGAAVVTPGQDDVIGPGLDELPVGAIVQSPDAPVAVARDAGGVYALVLVCTHMGCEVTPSGSGGSISIDCPCHGSRFDGNGAVLRGPAPLPLAHLAVDLDDFGRVVVHTTITVDASVRLAV